jgi:hypothetical protein
MPSGAATYLNIPAGQTTETQGRRIVVHGDGMWQIDIPLECRAADMVTLIPSRYSTLVEFPFCGMDEVSSIEAEGDVVSMILTYKGIPTPTGLPTYQTIRTASQEPLESNPLFLSLTQAELKYIAAYLQNPGAVVTVYDLSPAGLALLARKLRGQTDYLACGITYRQSYPSQTDISSDDQAGVGFIAAPPGNPATPAYCDWLYIGAESDQEGNAYRISKEWRLSALGGWDSYIYTPAT